MTRGDASYNRLVSNIACALVALSIRWPFGGPWWAVVALYLVLVNVEKCKP